MIACLTAPESPVKKKLTSLEKDVPPLPGVAIEIGSIVAVLEAVSANTIPIPEGAPTVIPNALPQLRRMLSLSSKKHVLCTGTQDVQRSFRIHHRSVCQRSLMQLLQLF